MGNKKAGIRLENKLKSDLEKLGKIVLHVKGSMGFCDLVSIDVNGEVEFISIKRALKKIYINSRFRNARDDIPDNLKVPVTIMIYSQEERKWHYKLSF